MISFGMPRQFQKRTLTIDNRVKVEARGLPSGWFGRVEKFVFSSSFFFFF